MLLLGSLALAGAVTTVLVLKNAPHMDEGFDV